MLYNENSIKTTEIAIRHYLPDDQAAVFTLSAETAFFGGPVEAFLEDRKLFVDAFARYYTEQEAAFAWVAQINGELVGFLFGCADTTSQTRKWREYIVRKVVPNAISGKYRLGQKTAKFATGMLMGILQGENPHVDMRKFPAHLQIDVKDGHRGQGVGRRLMESYLDQLKQIRVRGVYLETTSHNQAACHLYENVGFQLQDERLNRFWTRLMGFKIYNRSYALSLI